MQIVIDFFRRRDPLFFLGVLSAWPLFFTSESPFLYVNIIDQARQGLDGCPHPGLCHYLHRDYTYSISPALPIVCANLVIALFIKAYGQSKSLKQSHIFFDLITIALISVYLVYTSNSVRVLGVSSGLCILILFKNLSLFETSISLVKGFAFGLGIFVLFHAIWLLWIKHDPVSMHNGIAIFGFEIYQALVAYPAVLTLYFCTMVFVLFMKDSTKLFSLSRVETKIFLIFMLGVLGFTLSVLGKRASVLPISSVCFILFSSMLTWRNKALVCLMGFSIFVYWLNEYDLGSPFGFLAAVSTRLNYGLSIFPNIGSLTLGQAVFGFTDGWAQFHNLFVDLIAATGLLGFFLVGLTFVYHWNGFEKNIGISKSKYYSFFKLMMLSILVWDNLINLNFVLPYYLASFLLIFWFGSSLIKSSFKS